MLLSAIERIHESRDHPEAKVGVLLGAVFKENVTEPLKSYFFIDPSIFLKSPDRSFWGFRNIEPMQIFANFALHNEHGWHNCTNRITARHYCGIGAVIARTTDHTANTPLKSTFTGVCSNCFPHSSAFQIRSGWWFNTRVFITSP